MKALLAAAVVVLAVTAAAGAKTKPLPDVIALPNGLQPEGIEVGAGTTFYAGSRATGAVVAGDLRTGVVCPSSPRRAVAWRSGSSTTGAGCTWPAG